MRKLIFGIALGIVGLLRGPLFDHYLGLASSQVWAIVSVVCSVAGVICILLSKPVQMWIRPKRERPVLSTAIVFVICGSVGSAAWWLSLTMHSEPAPANGMLQEAPTIANVPKGIAITGGHVENATVNNFAPASAPPTVVISDDAIARALAKLQAQAPTVVGPFPPFSLGGSLADADVLDFISAGATSSWFPVKTPSDVTVDWSQFSRTPLGATITILGGQCRVAVLDTENGIRVAVSELVGPRLAPAVPPTPSPPNRELTEIFLPIPPSTGRKTYRLVVQPGPRPSTFWVSGEISFPIVSLGGSEAFFTPADDKALAGAAPGSMAATVDWKTVVPPINAVVVAAQMTVQFKEFQQTGKARVRVRDLNDGTITPSDWIEASWVGGMGASNRPQPKRPVDVRFSLPPAHGVHRYQLEVEVSRTGMSVSASGLLLMRH